MTAEEPASQLGGGNASELITAARARLSTLLGEGAGSSLNRAHSMSESYREIAGMLLRALADVRPAERPDDDAWAVVLELLHLLDRLVQDGGLAWLTVRELVHEALERLEEVGPVSELIERSAAEAGLATDLERVVLSRVSDGILVAESVYVRGDVEQAAATLARLRDEPVRIDYPLLEGEMLRRRRSLLITEADHQAHARAAHAQVMEWRDFVAVPVVLDGRVIGFLHGDRRVSARPLTGLDQAGLGLFATGFARTFERAVLRRRLRVQRQEIRKIANWADARTSELGERAINLDAGELVEAGAQHEALPSAPANGLGDLLTRRELDVLEQLANGRTNSEIAHALVISEGTVKFHVKNILRKMQVANRSEATAKYLRPHTGR